MDIKNGGILKYRDWIFWWICFCTPFIAVNKNLFPWGTFWGGTFSHNLVAYPLFMGLFYSLYLQWSGKEVFIYNKWLLFFVCGAILIETLAIVHGAYVFPYWDMIDGTSLPDKSRIAHVVLILQENGWLIDGKTVKRILFFYSLVKDTLLRIIIPYGGIYMIYCWYRNDHKRAVFVMEKAVISSIILLFVYCTIELFALCGNTFFTKLLFSLDNMLHFQGADKATEVEQWLSHWTLISKQMRGFFTEPSLLGIYANVMSAFLWYRILIDASKWAICCNVLLDLVVVLTSSRAAVGMQLGMLVIFIILITYKRDKELIKRGMIIGVSAVVALFVGVFFIKSLFLQSNKNVQIQSNKYASYVKGDVEGYFQSNIGSLMNKSSRSNSARYTYAYVALRTGMVHPVIGVGERFRSGYALKYIPEWGRNNREIKKYVEKLEEKGLWTNFPVINEYCENFATKGVIGLLWYLLPLLIGVMKMISLFRKSLGMNSVRYILFIELLVGIALAGLNNRWSMFYTPWIIFAIILIMIENEPKECMNVTVKSI